MGKTSLKAKKTGIKKPPRVEKVESHCQRKWPIMLGSDCSGMGTDVVAAKQLGIEFMVQDRGVLDMLLEMFARSVTCTQLGFRANHTADCQNK